MYRHFLNLLDGIMNFLHLKEIFIFIYNIPRFYFLQPHWASVILLNINNLIRSQATCMHAISEVKSSQIQI